MTLCNMSCSPQDSLCFDQHSFGEFLLCLTQTYQQPSACLSSTMKPLKTLNDLLDNHSESRCHTTRVMNIMLLRASLAPPSVEFDYLYLFNRAHPPSRRTIISACTGCSLALVSMGA